MIAKIDSLGAGLRLWYRQVEGQKSRQAMITKKVLVPDRVRKINGGFSFIPHRFLLDGFLEHLSPPELLLYLFLVLAADRRGLSYYSYERICALLHLRLEQYVAARDGLINKELIAFDGTLFQVLELPAALIAGERA
jgi:hypothetical protein